MKDSNNDLFENMIDETFSQQVCSFDFHYINKLKVWRSHFGGLVIDIPRAFMNKVLSHYPPDSTKIDSNSDELKLIDVAESLFDLKLLSYEIDKLSDESFSLICMIDNYEQKISRSAS